MTNIISAGMSFCRPAAAPWHVVNGHESPRSYWDARPMRATHFPRWRIFRVALSGACKWLQWCKNKSRVRVGGNMGWIEAVMGGRLC